MLLSFWQLNPSDLSITATIPTDPDTDTIKQEPDPETSSMKMELTFEEDNITHNNTSNDVICRGNMPLLGNHSLPQASVQASDHDTER